MVIYFSLHDVFLDSGYLMNVKHHFINCTPYKSDIIFGTLVHNSKNNGFAIWQYCDETTWHSSIHQETCIFISYLKTIFSPVGE